MVPIVVPPLRERTSDIPELVGFFVRRFAKELGRGKIQVLPETMEMLRRYHWPGNVRELQNILERAVILCTGDALVPELLPIEVLRPTLEDTPAQIDSKYEESGGIHFRLPDDGLDLEGLERSLIKQALEKAEGSQTRAARLLGISRYTLIYRLEKYGFKTSSS